MFSKVRHPFKGRDLNFKAIVATILFGAIILVFALFNTVTPDRGLGASGGSAAVVNDTTISINQFRQQVDMATRSSQLPLDKLPPEQREMYTNEIRRRTLDRMIMSELVFQNAYHAGIWASNGQLRDELLSIPVFQESGRFVRSRYDNILAQIGQTSDEFENQMRKDIVIRRLQAMFQTAASPSSTELDTLVALNSDIVNFRYVELSLGKLGSDKSVTDAEVKSFLADSTHQDEIKKYYEAHALDYNLRERVKARHILLLVDEKHADKDVAEKAKAIRAKLNKENFAKIAEKESQDPGSAKKGGDLGFFERGRMVPQFEEAAFTLKPGEISQPVKSDYGYHIIYVEQHEPARTVSLDEAKAGIAKKLVAQNKAPRLLDALKKAAETGKASDVESEMKKAGVSWEKAENVSLAAPQVAGMADPQDVMLALAKQKGKIGLVPGLVGGTGHSYIVDVTAWKTNPKPRSKEDLEKTLAYQESSDSFEDWVRDAETHASITRNPRLVEQR
jgi:peptidyl-prolyl cis-trans isomerase D